MFSIKYTIIELESVVKRLEPDSIDKAIHQTVKENDDIIVSLVRDQILQGRNSSGNELTPSYLQDPFFNTQKEAERYARMKYALQQKHDKLIWNPVRLFPDKDMNTPNLIVRGDFLYFMYINITSDGFNIGSTYVDAPDIERKYNNNIFSLADESKNYFWNEYLRNNLFNYIYGL